MIFFVADFSCLQAANQGTSVLQGASVCCRGVLQEIKPGESVVVGEISVFREGVSVSAARAEESSHGRRPHAPGNARTPVRAGEGVGVAWRGRGRGRGRQGNVLSAVKRSGVGKKFWRQIARHNSVSCPRARTPTHVHSRPCTPTHVHSRPCTPMDHPAFTKGE